MAEEMPKTSLTLAGAKEYLKENFVKYTIKKTGSLYFGLNIWEVQALEEVPNINSVRKRQFRLYTKGIEDDSPAWWEATQGPMSAPSPPAREPTFTEQAREYLRSEIKAGNIKAGELIFSDDVAERATAVVIDKTNTEKRVVIMKDAEGKFSTEEYTPLTSPLTVRI